MAIEHEPKPVIFLMGPTASGKTDLAVMLHEVLPVDIISVDSAMVYRGMDIGTAKPTADILARAPHRLIDICDPAEAYSAGRFREDARAAIRDIHARGRTPLLVGGTGLYFRGLERGISRLPGADPALRQSLEEEADSVGWKKMHENLQKIDPDSATRIHPNDPQRIQRALEVYELTGRPLSDWFRSGRSGSLGMPPVKLIVAPGERTRLHERIRRRFLRMLDDELVEEVRCLYERQDLHAGLPSMRLVGYRQVWQYLDEEINHKDMINKAITATRQLAKRQMTWLRAEQEAVRFDSEAPSVQRDVLNFLRHSRIFQ
ncbi:MAG: tRNA (adenosine(37)-N6)-dimethylallyltransferase MiaA [Gammaproteobacteria bacterium]